MKVINIIKHLYSSLKGDDYKLFAAVNRENVSKVEKYVERSHCIDIKDWRGITLVDLAREKNNKEILEVITNKLPQNNDQ